MTTSEHGSSLIGQGADVEVVGDYEVCAETVNGDERFYIYNRAEHYYVPGYFPSAQEAAYRASELHREAISEGSTKPEAVTS